MEIIRKIATNIPRDLLAEATKLSGLNQTQAIIAGLRELVAKQKRQVLYDLRGKIHISVDTNRSRHRKRT